MHEMQAQPALGSSKCILREESSTPQSMGGTGGAGAPEPAALLPGVEPLQSPQVRSCQIWRRAPWIWDQGSLPYEIGVKSKGFGVNLT